MTNGDSQLSEMYDRLIALVEQRPQVKVVATTAGDVDGAYQAVVAHLNEPFNRGEA